MWIGPALVPLVTWFRAVAPAGSGRGRRYILIRRAWRRPRPPLGLGRRRGVAGGGWALSFSHRVPLGKWLRRGPSPDMASTSDMDRCRVFFVLFEEIVGTPVLSQSGGIREGILLYSSNLGLHDTPRPRFFDSRGAPNSGRAGADWISERAPVRSEIQTVSEHFRSYGASLV